MLCDLLFSRNKSIQACSHTVSNWMLFFGNFVASYSMNKTVFHCVCISQGGGAVKKLILARKVRVNVWWRRGNLLCNQTTDARIIMAYDRLQKKTTDNTATVYSFFELFLLLDSGGTRKDIPCHSGESWTGEVLALLEQLSNYTLLSVTIFSYAHKRHPSITSADPQMLLVPPMNHCLVSSGSTPWR